MVYTDYSQIIKEIRSDLHKATSDVELAQKRAKTLFQLQEKNKRLNHRLYLTLLLDADRFDSFFKATSQKVPFWKFLNPNLHYARWENKNMFIAYAKYLGRIEHYGEFLSHSEGYGRMVKKYANFHPSTDIDFMKAVGVTSPDIVYDAYFNLVTLIEAGFVKELEKTNIENPYEIVAKIVFLTGEVEQAKTYVLLPGSYLTQMLVSLNSNH